MTNSEWLESLKAGDRIFMNKAGYGNRMGYDTGVVSRITKTTIFVNPKYNPSLEIKFKKSNGKKVDSDRWSSIYLVPPTEETIREYKTANRTYQVKRMLENIEIPKTLEELDNLVQILQPLVKKDDQSNF